MVDGRMDQDLDLAVVAAGQQHHRVPSPVGRHPGGAGEDRRVHHVAAARSVSRTARTSARTAMGPSRPEDVAAAAAIVRHTSAIAPVRQRVKGLSARSRMLTVGFRRAGRRRGPP